jgi:thiol:disulfide interchange protein DsbC
MLVFSPPAERVKATLNVFTDIDCGYCRKLHQEVPELNRLGIAVRYLAYPRAGVESVSYDKYVSAWCADNQQEAFTMAKLGEPITDKTCNNPVAVQHKIGAEMGVTGTPALLYNDGRLEMGYRNAATLARMLGVTNP